MAEIKKVKLYHVKSMYGSQVHLGYHNAVGWHTFCGLNRDEIIISGNDVTCKACWLCNERLLIEELKEAKQ